MAYLDSKDMFTSYKCHMNALPHGQTPALLANAGQTGLQMCGNLSDQWLQAS